MSAIRTAIISCDSCGDEFAFTYPTVTETRASALESGWTHARGVGDRCQLCTARPMQVVHPTFKVKGVTTGSSRVALNA